MPGSRPNIFDGVTDYFTELTRMRTAFTDRPKLSAPTPPHGCPSPTSSPTAMIW